MTIRFHIQENSKIAWIAAKKLGSRKIAIVFGKTIYLHNTTREEFLSNSRWVRHELVHVRQYEQYGTLRFLLLYLLESIKKGYYNNRFEVEARSSELLSSEQDLYSMYPPDKLKTC
jgi:hypothetical protein